MWALALLATGSWPVTKAEATNYRETSSYEDVVSFLKALEGRGALRLRFIGESTEKRPIPLAIMSHPPVASLAEARKAGKLVIYLQGNIHAGEVEGKESALIFLRNLAQARAEGKRTILDRAVLVTNPIYNSDGNEKWGPVAQNRPEQDGPERVGVRPNGQGFDLNRDCIKAESPEMRAVLEHIYKPWDPDVVMDLHTTDGTRHGYDLTYSPPLHPNTPPAIREYTQEKLLPEVRKASKYKLFDYGNAVTRQGKRVWETFGWEGRYVTNYAGLTGRVGILSEATTFLPFKDRVESTLAFVEDCLVRVTRDKGLVFAARRNSAPKELGIRFKMAQSREEGVLLEKSPGKKEKKPDAIEVVSMPVFDRFEATTLARVPKTYYLAGSEFAAIRLLRRHGVQMDALVQSASTQVEVFTPTIRTQASQPFQGHKLLRFEGTYEAREVTLPAGTLAISTQQPLWPLVFELLEPQGADGLVAWGAFGEDFTGTPFPILKSVD